MLFVALAGDMVNAADPASREATTDALIVDETCAASSAPAASIENAVIAMSRCFLDSSVREDREYIGAVFRIEAGYTFVVHRGEIGRGNAHLRVRIPRGLRVVAMWHTHGAPGPARHLFSPSDTKLVARMNLPLYLTDPAGAIRVYRPGDARGSGETRTGSRMQIVPGSAIGTLVVSRVGEKAITAAATEESIRTPPAESQEP